MRTLGSWIAIPFVGGLLCTATFAQVTERVSLSYVGNQVSIGGNLPSPSSCVVTDDGRFVVFTSGSYDVIPGDTNGSWDAFVRDRQLRTTEIVSVDSHGAQANGDSAIYGLAISPDGRFVAFESRAALAPGDTNDTDDVFIRDRLSGTTERVSVATGGAQGNGWSLYPVISPDARYVAFASVASNLASGDTNGAFDVFVRDRVNHTTERVSVATGGAQANDYSLKPAISSDGRFVAFYSAATNLVPGDTNGTLDVFVRDRLTRTTERVSVATGGAQGNGHSSVASLSSDGRYVAFLSESTNLVTGDTNGHRDVFVRDRQSGTTERVNIGVGGMEANADTPDEFISSDGRYVSFQSAASNLVPGDQPGVHAFVRDRLLGATERVSIPTDGTLTLNDQSLNPCISSTGRFVVFQSNSTNLISGDTNGETDVFLHDRDATGFATLCSPGSAGVIACPCGNPPGGQNQGCDNSAATGGASLSASGISYLTMDSLVFTTSGEKPTATSILLQGTAMLASGAVYGQGVRCVDGTLKRLFTKTAVAGSITAPESGSGDPTVSARSAALGDVIQPGQSRWYLVYYRDPTVLGGCPASSTFNTTQTGRVDWSF